VTDFLRLFALLAGMLVVAGVLFAVVAFRGRKPSETGCCSSCGGSGYSGEECTGGACWDCQATGHPHLGRCRSRFLDWWHLREGSVVLTAMVWTIITTAFGAPAFYGLGSWLVAVAVCVSVGPALLAILAMIFLGRAADRQIRRRGLPPARQVSR
jgi:hypothetical protein